ncbi:unnamed protein product [Moneuplotes crassus]|uniref:Uncharacterized protein n=1 Tax=Euplotes crassus TaxID=5936 RepID=A0AAD1U517_EUPCR|nr:unnamed protein product [Moneuplotes crassus]
MLQDHIVYCSTKRNRTRVVLKKRKITRVVIEKSQLYDKSIFETYHFPRIRKEAQYEIDSLQQKNWRVRPDTPCACQPHKYHCTSINCQFLDIKKSLIEELSVKASLPFADEMFTLTDTQESKDMVITINTLRDIAEESPGLPQTEENCKIFGHDNNYKILLQPTKNIWKLFYSILKEKSRESLKKSYWVTIPGDGQCTHSTCDRKCPIKSFIKTKISQGGDFSPVNVVVKIKDCKLLINQDQVKPLELWDTQKELARSEQSSACTSFRASQLEESKNINARIKFEEFEILDVFDECPADKTDQTFLERDKDFMNWYGHMIYSKTKFNINLPNKYEIPGFQEALDLKPSKVESFTDMSVVNQDIIEEFLNVSEKEEKEILSEEIDIADYHMDKIEDKIDDKIFDDDAPFQMSQEPHSISPNPLHSFESQDGIVKVEGSQMSAPVQRLLPQKAPRQTAGCKRDIFNIMKFPRKFKPSKRLFLPSNKKPKGSKPIFQVFSTPSRPQVPEKLVRKREVKEIDKSVESILKTYKQKVNIHKLIFYPKREDLDQRRSLQEFYNAEETVFENKKLIKEGILQLMQLREPPSISMKQYLGEVTPEKLKKIQGDAYSNSLVSKKQRKAFKFEPDYRIAHLPLCKEGTILSQCAPPLLDSRGDPSLKSSSQTKIENIPKEELKKVNMADILSKILHT